MRGPEVCERKFAKSKEIAKPVSKSAALAKLKANMSVGAEVGDLLDVEQRTLNPETSRNVNPFA